MYRSRRVRTTVVLLAHGSPDPRHRQAVQAQAERTATVTGLPVRCAYLETDTPSPEQLGAELTGTVLVVPMLITPAYHARVDLPRAADLLGRGGGRVVMAESLAPDPMLVAGCVEVLDRCGVDPSGRVVLVAGGSSDGVAARGLAALVARHGPPTWRTTTLADLDPVLLERDPAVGTYLPEPPAAVLPFVLAEGVLHDRVGRLARSRHIPVAAGGLLGTAALDRLIGRRVGLSN
ncbi:sirohydrochlorin ferrochelatase [Marihabitans asiaticum]|uniref:Sirohydrochlorin ferrochelatase n=1 Tax=Marihabitans asiaticum TaxID=415218 RepID=A0A560WBE2_9MICO|nr:sirohydrochlorin ferrochelatase [Marihabitans asiaticum]